MNMNDKKANELNTNNSNLFDLTLLILFSLLPGFLLKLIFPQNASLFGGDQSYLTGFPFLRNRLQLIEVIGLNILLNVYFYFKSESFNLLVKLKFAFFFQNCLQLIMFYVILAFIRGLIKTYFGFEFSGHYIICLLAVLVIANIKSTIEYLNTNEIGVRIFKYINLFLAFHYFYSLTFTFWIYHTIPEALSGCLVGVLCNYLVSKTNPDDYIIKKLQSHGYIHEEIHNENYFDLKDHEKGYTRIN